MAECNTAVVQYCSISSVLAIFFFNLFQIYLYRVDHSVRLFFHGALLQN